MNKKLIKTIASITCGLGVVTTIPAAITSCKKTTITLHTRAVNVIGFKTHQIIATTDLSSYVYTGDGEKVDEKLVSFELSQPLHNGLNFNPSTGQIFGTPNESIEIKDAYIIVSAKIDGKIISGHSNLFDITIGDETPTSLRITTQIPDITSYTSKELEPTADLKSNVETDTDLKITHNLKFTCQNLPRGLEINQANGVISGTPTEPVEASGLKIHVSFIFGDDINIEGDSDPFNIKILPAPANLKLDTTIANVDGFTTRPITNTPDLKSHILTNTDEHVTSDVIFETNGTWPKGIKLDRTTGIISGTSTEVGNFQNLSIKFSTTYQGFKLVGISNVFSINILKAPTKLELNNYSIPDINVISSKNIPDTKDLTGSIKTDTEGVVVPTKGIKFEKQGNWPTGVNLNETTGVITGAPTEVGNFTNLSIKFSATVEGFALTGVSNTFDINVNPQPTKLELRNYSIPSTFTTVVVGEQWTINPESLNSYIYSDTGTKASNVTYSIDGALPAGYTINTSTGVISGKATAIFQPTTIKIKFSASVEGFSLTGESGAITISSISSKPKSLAISPISDVSWPYLINLIEGEVFRTTTQLNTNIIATLTDDQQVSIPLENLVFSAINENTAHADLVSHGFAFNTSTGQLSGQPKNVWYWDDYVSINFSAKFHNEEIKNVLDTDGHSHYRFRLKYAM